MPRVVSTNFGLRLALPLTPTARDPQLEVSLCRHPKLWAGDGAGGKGRGVVVSQSHTQKLGWYFGESLANTNAFQWKWTGESLQLGK